MQEHHSIQVVPVLRTIRAGCLKLFGAYFGPDCTLVAESWEEVNRVLATLEPNVRVVQSLVIGHATLNQEVPLDFRLAFNAVLQLSDAITLAVHFFRARAEVFSSLDEDTEPSEREEIELSWQAQFQLTMSQVVSALAAVINATQFEKITGKPDAGL